MQRQTRIFQPQASVRSDLRRGVVPSEPC
jgi:hypothetical protein